jgi:hypothetical protein
MVKVREFGGDDVLVEAAANFGDREVARAPSSAHRQVAYASAQGTKVDIRAGYQSGFPIAIHQLTRQHPPRLLATVKMLIPKADRKLIHELVFLTTTTANATLRSSSEVSHEITT